MKMYYVTKWFLTKGILELPGNLDEEGKYVHVKAPGRLFSTAISYGIDVFERKSEADRRAKKILKMKILLMERQLTLLKSKYEKMAHSEE